MEIDITRLASDLDPYDFSRSIAEAGYDAGPSSWANAKAVAPPIVRRRHCAAVKAYFAEFGAWSPAEIRAWSWQDCSAIVLQFASGDLREAQACAPGDGVAGVDWHEAERLAEIGTLSGTVYPQGGRLYISLDR